MSASLVEVAMTFSRPDWLSAARNAYDFVISELVLHSHGSEIELLHSWRNGDARHRATLDDYAALARAGLALHEATGDQTPLSHARNLVAYLDAHFLDQDGAYFFTDDRATDVIARTKSGFDNATPAGNGIIAEVLVHLFYLTGETSYRDRAEGVLRAFAGEIEQNAFGYGTLLMASGLLADATQVTIIGAPDDTLTEVLRAAAYKSEIPMRIVMTLTPGAALPDNHPAYGKTQINGAATAYVCRGSVCSPPVQTSEALLLELSR
ncbi:unnamed protein product [Laminaria digitata]